MNIRGINKLLKPAIILTILMFSVCHLTGQNQMLPKTGTNDAIVVSFEGKLEFSRAGTEVWDPSYSNQVLQADDRLRTGERSRALVRFSDTTIRLGDLSYMSVPKTTKEQPVMSLIKGLYYFFHRDQPERYLLRTPTVSAIVRGTEFVVNVTEDGTTTFSLLAGAAQLSSGTNLLDMSNGEMAVIEPGEPQSLSKSAMVNAFDLVQWCLYYPGVLRIQDLELDSGTQTTLRESLAAYQTGDLKTALARYPRDRKPETPEEQVYLAALLVSVGETKKAEVLLKAPSLNSGKVWRLRMSLQKVIDVVQFKTNSPAVKLEASSALASEWLAESYVEQSHFKLGNALADAQKAVEVAPDFGFGWERVAELEFSFGRIAKAKYALDQSLTHAPDNAEALSLRGFLFAAQYKIEDAISSFNQAMAKDGALGNAWLGRGLSLIRQGKLEAGRADLQSAATLEPNRSLLRSYLGKAWSEAGNTHRANEELALAKLLDPNDPTPWLYSALMRYNEYQIADAIEDLEQSKERNDNRQIYRSRLLLDKDNAVRSANLADIYKDAEMTDVSLSEAARAVSFDYASFAAHRNLASTFNDLRDPTRFNLRYESEWFNETLLAGMLAPPGAVSLSENLSQQEYARLFSQDTIGLEDTSEYFSSKEVRETATQYGSVDGLSWDLDLFYQYKAGIRVNNQLSEIDWDSHIKQQITPDDSLYLMITYENYDAGDQFQYHDQSQAQPGYHLTETQTPSVLVGWHHEWSPGSHTLLLVGRLEDKQHVTDTNANQLTAQTFPLTNPYILPFDIDYHNQFVIYSAEFNQILQREHHTDIFGVRYQNGTVKADALFSNPPLGEFPPNQTSSTDARFQRVTPYAYHHWEVIDGLMLIGGLAYDYEQYPANYRRPPLSNDEKEKYHWSPKAALIWNPTPELTLRGVFSRSLGGMSFDESIRLEPTQLAGFGQSFRSLISESLIGSVEAPEYQIAGGALDWHLQTNTWLNLSGQYVTEKVQEDAGDFLVNFNQNPLLVPFPGSQSSINENFDYDEASFKATLNQIVGKDWFLQAQYQFSFSDLQTGFPNIPVPSSYNRVTDGRGRLQQVRLSATWQEPRGLFARGEVWWFGQALGGVFSSLRGDSFAQVNIYAGYRFPSRRGELAVGVLNLTDGGYHLSPINYYLDLPYQRTLYVRCRFDF